MVLYQVIRNTYPAHKGVKRADDGDVCFWGVQRGDSVLVRESDKAVVFSRTKIADDHRPLSGVIASTKSKGWFLELAKIN